MNRIFVAALLLALAALAAADCPGGCSNHGNCASSGVCQCNTYYTGTDCSIYERTVSNGQTVSNSVANHEWQFYAITVPTGADELTVHVHQKTPGDADLYLKQGSYPRRDSYDQVDLGRGDDFELSQISPEQGVWYAGVYGFFGCDYDISVTIQSGDHCPNDCSGHGRCQGLECTCNDGWVGEDCSSAVKHLVSQQSMSESVAQAEWKYYYLDITNENELRIIVNETTEAGDSDIYVRKDSMPSLWEFDYRDSSIQHNYQLTVDGVSRGTYFVGIYGYRATSYRIEAQYGALEVCENRCSDHGECSGRVCSCMAGYSGESCENLDAAMTLDKWYPGFVRDNSWNYYHVAPASADNLVVSVRQQSGGDCDLYVKAGSPPSRFDYEARDVSFDQEFELVVENPQDQTWYIGVFGYQQCQYQIRSHTSASACPNSCSHHGQCVSGRCDCQSGWAGIDCAAPLHHLSNGVPRTGDAVGMNHWQYYKFEVVQDSSYLTVEVLETNTIGNIWLYVNQGAPPTLSDYTDSSTDMDTPNHAVYFRTNAAGQDANYYVGVYGSPLASSSSPIAYTVIAYSPPL
eukprot:TRINITY_DN525_c0_g1_i1.p1 TRINITY_DN525_c0_g1~~TRINITY_DN525_c0_g1_i1.p1  ORF type:complete len:574 (-),score=194.62 TRINITY_DN525_c0_g1_i1:43-1764(-)